MSVDIHDQRLLIVDFGGQYTQLIARRVREAGVYCEIYPFDAVESAVRESAPRGVILGGGPESVTGNDTPRIPDVIFELDVPVLGICYGMQAMAEQLGGRVEPSTVQEFGHAVVKVAAGSELLGTVADGADRELQVWMSHGDKVVELPDGFTLIAATDSAPIAAMERVADNYYGVQFHPEVTHTPKGATILHRFARDICGCDGLWTAANIIDDAIAQVRETVGADRVVLGLSGGVDSSVVAALLSRAIGDQLSCVFVDNGLLRKNEREEVERAFAPTNVLALDVITVDARDEFLRQLAGTQDPEG